MNRLRLVGGVGLTGPDGQDVRAVLAQPKRLALLVYLAVARPQGFHRRDTLLGLFWSESNEDTARAALSRALHHLRQALGAEAIVSRGDDEVALDATRVTSDLSEFTEALERGDMSGALALYTSDFLAGFHVDGTPEFDRWVEGERDRIRILAFTAATGAAHAAERDRDLAGAVMLAARASELSPYNEPAALDLMRLLAAQGNRADALRAYDAFERRLRSDLDAAPGQALADAAEQIRKGSAPAASAAPAHGSAAHGSAAHGSAAHESAAHGSAAHENAARKPDVRAQPPVRADQPPVAVEALRRPSPRMVAVSMAAAAIIIAALVWGWRAAVRDRDGVAVRFVISTPDEGASPSPPAMSPDGRTVVFSARRGRVSMLYRRVLDDSTAYPIAGTEHARQPFFSPDGSWVGFLDSTGLKKVRLTGEAPVPIGPIGVTNGATWAWGDVIVVCAQHVLLAIPASGGAPRPIAPLDSAHGELAQEWPLALDDGETVLYASLIGVFDSTRIGVASLKKATPRLLDLPPGSAVPLAVIDGRLVYATTTGALMAVPFDARAARITGTPVQVGDGALLDRVSGAARAAISPSGSLAYAIGTPLSQLVLVDVQGRERLLAPEAKAYGFPRYSPDGRHVAVTVVTPGSMDVWTVDGASGTSMKLTSEGYNDRPEWTADGKRILYRRRVETPVFRYELWWQPSDGSGSSVQLQDPPAG